MRTSKSEILQDVSKVVARKSKFKKSKLISTKNTSQPIENISSQPIESTSSQPIENTSSQPIENISSQQTISKRKAKKQIQVVSDNDSFDYSYSADEVFDNIFDIENSDDTIQNLETSMITTPFTNIPSSSTNLNNFSSQSISKNTSKKLRKIDKTIFQLNTETGNMIQHLLTIHQMNEISESQQVLLIIQPDRQQDLTFDLIDWIIDDMQPFLVTKNKKYRKLINILYPDYKISAISTIKNIIFKAVQYTEEKLKQLFSSTLISASFTTDEWTSNHKPFIGITIHWISEDFKLHQVLLALEKNPYPHKALNIFQKLKSILEKFKVEDKIIAGVTDNASNIPLQDVSTRWNSFLFVIQPINDIIKILEKFANATKLLSENYYPTLLFTYPIICELFKYLELVKRTIHTSQAKLLQSAIYESMNEKWNNQNDIGIIAAFFDPRFKLLKFTNSEKADLIMEFIKSKLLDLERLDNINEDPENLISKNNSTLSEFFGEDMKLLYQHLIIILNLIHILNYYNSYIIKK
ncbi:1256_t:CDS:2 [Racocetra fulgida]|uniref:1256_t:CDS:1 n=1 Tax=Racocetra fulgida TaxID=60492 RepID=A0A9N9FGZ9_9GLOM|nr:1256_t:CDS:2 [Racocetra fulgida]